jgi:ornithine carbamoyltransferase
MYDAIEYRGFGQDTAEELAKWAGVPIYNGLTDEWHPTQILADFLTFREHVPKPLTEVRFYYLGVQHGGLVSDRWGEAGDGRPDREPEVTLAA